MGKDLSLAAVIRAMLRSKETWTALVRFAEVVLRRIEEVERRRQARERAAAAAASSSETTSSDREDSS